MPEEHLPADTYTGLYDSEGTAICIGDSLKIKVTCNTKYHGEWSVYEVTLRGIVPCLMYVTSEKGDLLPRGYTGCALSEKYDAKMFLWHPNLTHVRPMDEMVVIKGNSDANM